MVRARHTTSRSLYLFPILLTCSLFLSSIAPFTVRAAKAERERTSSAPLKANRYQKKKGGWRNGDLLIRFNNISLQQRQALVQSLGAKSARRLRGNSLTYKLKLAEGQDAQAVAAQLRSNPAVQSAEPNYLVSRDEVVPNDPRFAEQWALRNTGTGADIQAASAWETSTGAPTTVIAVIDSGIDFSHPDLTNNRWTNTRETANGQDDDHNGLIDDLHGWDWVAESSTVRDEMGHGTSVAGIIAAEGNNAEGISGVMWRASLMSLRMLDGTGIGDISAAVEAIDYAVANGAKVINCSWGTDEYSTLLKDAIERAGRAGVLVVTSAGNDGRDIDAAPYYPASYNLPNVISVASVDVTGSLAAWSNWGATSVQVAAPGVDILSTKMGGGYEVVSGTSSSAPLVTGMAGLIRTLRPLLTAERTREMLTSGVRSSTALGGKVSSGGIVSANSTLGVVNTLPADEGKESTTGDTGSSTNQTSPVFTGSTGGTGDTIIASAPPRRKGPKGTLPNIDQMRQMRTQATQAPAPIPSTRPSLFSRPTASSGTAPATPPPPPIPGISSIGQTEAPPRLLASLSSQFMAWAESSPGGLSDSPFSIWNSHSRGKSTFPALLSPQTQLETVWVDDSVPGGTEAGTPGEGWNWVSVSPAPYSGAKAHQSVSASGLHNHYFYSSPQTLSVNTGDSLFFYVYLDPTDTPSEIMVQWNDGTNWTNVYWGGDWITGLPRQYMGTLPAAGQWVRLEVPASAIGLEGKTLSGMAFNAFGGRVTWDRAGKLYTGTTQYDTLWVEDHVPTGATQAVYGDAWNWTTNNPAPYSGLSAHKSNLISGLHNHYFYSATETLLVNTGDKLFAYIYIEPNTDPTKVPEEVMLQWNDGTTWYNAYWGNSNPIGVTAYHAGGLPAVGQWVRLEVPASALGLEGKTLRGMAFDLYNGRATWDRAGKTGAGATQPASDSYAEARLDPDNRTGTGGEDLLSRNYNWNLPILSLPGRSGLDLGLSLSYNSLVWTKYGNSILFDADHGFPSPGFRIGFPVVQKRFYNSQTGKNAYLLITPSGSRVELRQLNASNIYESADSSYLQLTDNGGSLFLQTTDGTQLSYVPFNGEYYCTEIKDRNGNYITVNYADDNSGRITTVVDTLQRTITFNYDINKNLTSITQTWKRDTTAGLVTETHTWATFGWTDLTIQTSFSGLTLVGVQNNQVIPVLNQVGLADNSRYTFEYTLWGQVKKINNYASNDVLLNYVSYNLDTTAGQTDCPRFTERIDYAHDWSDVGQTTTSFTAWGANAASAQVTMPDGTFYKEYYGTAGWQRGLTTKTESGPSGSAPKKTTTLTWTQDNEALSYQLNPRVKDTTISDSDGRNKRTRISYTSYGLPSDVYEYDSDAVKVLRHTHTDYRLDPYDDADYLSRHIIGLVKSQAVYDGNGDDNDSNDILFSKVEYSYDEADEVGLQLLASAGDPVQYDTTFGTNFRQGRGLVTSIRRINIQNTSESILTRIGYNTAGSVLFTKDPLGHQVTISYADSFSDNVNHNTLAYPTTVTDAGGSSSTTKYNYDMGVAVSKTVPTSGDGTTSSPITYLEQQMFYDNVGRIERVSTPANGAYQKWAYYQGTLLHQFTKTQEGVEAFTFTIFDGHGRVNVVGGDLPDSSGGNWAQYNVYDNMGRLIEKSNPTEVTSGWVTTGDDTGDWVITTQQYDWKGRPTITTNQDGTTKEVAYVGCGCAGSESVVTRDEIGRRQKVTYDVLGRVRMAEVLFEQAKNVTLDGSGTVYSAVVNIYNVLDQVSSVKQYAGAEGSSTPQETALTYDGYGRLKTKKIPAATAATEYRYNADNTLQQMIDGRGATTNYAYNSRHMVTGISYTAPSGITAPGSITYAYDAAGNRTSMADGSGSMAYQYNSLRQLTSETRTFSGVTGSFTLSYTYNLVGQLASITDPFNATINYAYDSLGRVTGITGSSFGGITQYTSQLKYRSWGAIKQAHYGDSNDPRSLSIQYSARLLPSSFTVSGLINKSYQYRADGSLQYSQDHLDARFDRSYSYDHIGRITQALSGIEARGGQSSTGQDRPYKETFTYDALSHLTARTTGNWTQNYSMTDAYQNDRNVDSAYTYDTDGRPLLSPDIQYTYDASGRISTVTTDSTTTQAFDGDGQRVKTVEASYNEQTLQPESITKLYVPSSVLGGSVISEVSEQGHKQRTYVYSGGGVLARQEKAQGAVQDHVQWEHRDISNASLRTVYAGGYINDEKELDPLGADAALGPNLNDQPPPDEGGNSLIGPTSAGSPSQQKTAYGIMGIAVSADTFMRSAELKFPSGLGFAMLERSIKPIDYVWVPARRSSRFPIPATTPFDYDEVNDILRGGITAPSAPEGSFQPVYPDYSWSFAVIAGLNHGETTDKQQNSGFYVGGVKKLVANNPKCANFLNALLNKLGIKGTFLDLLSSYAARGVYRNSDIEQKPGKVTLGIGGIVNGQPKVDVDLWRIAQGWSGLYSLEFVIIHETFHALDRTISHMEMAVNAYSIAKEMELMKSPYWEPKTDLPQTDQDERDNSVLFQNILWDACKPTISTGGR
jgi:YD repeat-containing protein